MLTLLFLASITRADTRQNISREVDARLALSNDARVAELAIESLRAAGPDGLRVLTQTHAEFLQRALQLSSSERAGNADWKRLKFALDQTGAQCDNWASKLYWFTDLQKAKAAAQEEHKPILSLRLLGNLNEELSCANSRFFRTALYPNANINEYLRAHFILHWQSVRPAPKVTIDFGDGRKIQTTITGNSIHYVLDSKGRVLDALPGLYSPAAFARWLAGSDGLFVKTSMLDDAACSAYLKRFHHEQSDQIAAQWTADLQRASLNAIQLGIFGFRANASSLAPPFQLPARGTTFKNPNVAQSVALSAPEQLSQALKNDPQKIEVPTRGGVLGALPTARRAAPLAASKIIAERPLLERITMEVPRDRNVLKRSTTDELWTKIANLYAADARLDFNSLQVLKTKSPRAQTVAATFEKSIAEDTVRNEYTRHTLLHQWLAKNPNFDLDALNKKVYAEMFLTPDSDPWLGLLPTEAYIALQNDGVTAN